MLVIGFSSCGGAVAGEGGEVARESRYGVLRDLVVYVRRRSEGGSFLLDRFETTRGDWDAYLRAIGSAGASAAESDVATGGLPVARVTLREARRFARWRFCRLLRQDEWVFAATGRGAYRYPWGETFRAAWVNSAELGLAAPTAVGTFESGRDDGGAYDLLGNVAEWTESAAPRWFASSLGAPGAGLAQRRLRALGEGWATRRWRWVAAPWPAAWWVAAGGDEVPRLAVGGHFRAFVQEDLPTVPGRNGSGASWARGPRERGDTVGIRLATDPAELVRSLAAEPQGPSRAEAAELRAFLQRPEVRELLRPVWRIERAASRPHGPLGSILDRELGG